MAELDTDTELAVAMAGQWLADTSGVDFLRACHQLYPAAKRLLLITYGDVIGGTAALRAMALGQLDHYLNKPWGDPSWSCIPPSLSCSASGVAPRSRQALNQRCCGLSGRNGRPDRMSCGTLLQQHLMASTTSPAPRAVGCCSRSAYRPEIIRSCCSLTAGY